jgi:hypothetical protein
VSQATIVSYPVFLGLACIIFIKKQGWYITMPWCRFFVPKIAVPGINAEDPALNEQISYAKCIKGHVLKDAQDWVCCENLPAPDARCWQEGGDTIFSLSVRQRNATKDILEQKIQNAKNNGRDASQARRGRV